MGFSISTGGKEPVRSEPNVVPLCDVLLVLLIIFMVVTPMLQRGKDVMLPKAKVIDKDPGTGDPLILSITSDKRVWVDKDSFDANTLEQKLRDEIIAQPTRAFLLKGDSRVTVGDIRKVMAIARKAGARGVRIAVDQVKPEGQG